MKIYGVALLAVCFLVGKIIGNGLGAVLNIDGDVGGVGFAMLFLILTNNYMKQKGWLDEETKDGVLFWGAMYIPIVIAMSATQNVKAAWNAGGIALLAGVSVVLIGFMLVPLISRIGQGQDRLKIDEK
jgi:malonate transporter MadL subunit